MARGDYDSERVQVRAFLDAVLAMFPMMKPNIVALRCYNHELPFVPVAGEPHIGVNFDRGSLHMGEGADGYFLCIHGAKDRSSDVELPITEAVYKKWCGLLNE
jgi:hypothetical protein